MTPWLVVLGIGVTAWISAGIILYFKGKNRSADDEISEFIRTSHGRKIPPRSPSRNKRGL